MTQREALNILKTGANVFLTGEPGSGKTFTVNEYVKYLKEHDIEPSITASTGIAATHIGGHTIHSWSGIGIRKNLTKYDFDFISNKEYVAKRIERTKVLIIDEISMLDGATLDAVDTVCRLVKRNESPFGRIQVVLVGDFFQLPPVSGKNDSDCQFAFKSKTWKDLNPLICYITEQYRQDDGDFLSVLSAIRRNEFGKKHMNILESRIDLYEDTEDGIPKLFSHNEDVDRINKGKLDTIEEEAKVFEMESHGRDVLVENLKRGCLSPEKLELKVGASVMFTKNNSNQGFVNGTLGEVAGFSEYTSYPIVRTKNGSLIEIGPMDWTIEENNKVKAKITQIPLRLAWAITIHKSQGMSMDAALMDLSQVFEFGQGYVALSRVKRLSGLYLLGTNEKTFKVHPEVLEEDERFRRLSEEAEEAFADIPEEELSKMRVNFILACGGRIEIFKKGAKMTKIREKYPKAYTKWTAEEEKMLCEKFLDGTEVKILAREFGRKTGGIRSRLVKLGLLEEENFD